MVQKKLSLQEQLLQSGLVSSAQVKSVKSEKNKQIKQQRHNNIHSQNETKLAVERGRAELAERDKDLNRIKQQSEEKKLVESQIRQLIEMNRLEIDEAAIEDYDDSRAYHFSDQNRIKKIFVSKEMRKLISEGELAIVKIKSRYSVVPKHIATKIKERDAGFVVVFNEKNTELNVENNDPYSSYTVPDELMW